MTTLAGGGNLICIPFDLGRGDPARVTRLLDHMAEHAHWFAAGLTPEEARANAAWMLANTEDWKFEIWSGGTFAGMFLLSRILPKVDALFHFTLLPAKETGVTLFGTRKLAHNFLGYAFETFDLQRISVEVPEHSPKLAHWLRQRLGFRYEGEMDTERLAKNKAIIRLGADGTAAWVAAQGSRRERSHWNGTAWSDLLLLRLLRSEYDARASLGDTPQATQAQPVDEVVGHESPQQTGAVQATPAPRASRGHPQATAGG